MTREDIRTLVVEAALAPSVHNVQPARWRFDGDGVTLFEDVTRRLTAGDPHGRDAAMSLGAATEGLAIAMSSRGLALVDQGEATCPTFSGNLRPVRRFAILPGAILDPLHGHVATRQSWRGRFAAVTGEHRVAARTLSADDTAVIDDAGEVSRVAGEIDHAGYRFFRDDGFRAELLSWMRLRCGDPRWPVDGLNADAMAMSGIEARGAGLVMGPLFHPLDRIGLVAPLTAEAATIRSAAAILLFHRPTDEPRFDSGRAFYRLWLRLEATGLSGAVMASLADDRAASASVVAQIPEGRTLVSALRVGSAPLGAGYRRARLRVDDLIV